MPERRGREAAEAALIEAAADLLANAGDVSVRTIAAKAGVNHGLVHHYFGGKEGLRAAVLDHLAAAQAARLTDVDFSDPVALARATLAVARDDHRMWRILARALLDGEVPARMQTAYPVVRRVVTALQARGIPDARQRVAEAIAVTFGWMMFEPWITAATDLPKRDADRLLDALIDTHVQALTEA